MKLNRTSDFPFLRWLREPRLLIIAGGVTLMVMVTALALIQTPTVAAPPPPLRGPFRFIELPQGSAATAANSSVQWTPFYTQTFGDDFSGWTLTYTMGLYDNPSTVRWDRVLQSTYPGEAFTNTLWVGAFQQYRPVNYIVYADSTYTTTMDTWAIYQLDTQQFPRFKADFWYWVDTEAGASLGWAFSCDGTNFYGSATHGHARQWQPMNITMDGCPGQVSTPAYLAFYFQSSATETPVGLGAFVDNLVISGVSWKRAYMPSIWRGITPTPTPTSTPSAGARELVKSYYYEVQEDPRWCENNNYDQRWAAVRESVGGGSKAYRMWTNRPDKFMLSPQYDPPSDYSIETKFSFQDMSGFNMVSHAGAKFGLIFGVNDVVFNPWDPNHCDADPSGGGYYEFRVRVNGAGTGYEYQLRRLQGGAEQWSYAGWAAMPAGVSISSTAWNTLRLDRKGAGIVVYINGQQIVSTTEGTWTGTRWWGLTIDCPTCNDGNLAFRVNWDDTQIYRILP